MRDIPIRKILSILALTGFLFATAVFPLRHAEANFQVPTLEVTGILVELDESRDPMVMTLNVNGIEAAGHLASHCEFVDSRGQLVELRTFVSRYQGMMITVELYEFEYDGAIFLCSAH